MKFFLLTILLLTSGTTFSSELKSMARLKFERFIECGLIYIPKGAMYTLESLPIIVPGKLYTRTLLGGLRGGIKGHTATTEDEHGLSELSINLLLGGLSFIIDAPIDYLEKKDGLKDENDWHYFTSNYTASRKFSKWLTEDVSNCSELRQQINDLEKSSN